MKIGWLVQITKKEGFKYVLDAFHVVNTKAIQERFYDVVNEDFLLMSINLTKAYA